MEEGGKEGRKERRADVGVGKEMGEKALVGCDVLRKHSDE